MSEVSSVSIQALNASAVAWLSQGLRVLCIGNSGAGKSTWIEQRVRASAPAVRVLSADVAKPLCGPPGAVSVSAMGESDLELVDIEGIATLDGVRHRHAILMAASRLHARLPAQACGLLVDTPGVLKGQGARDLMTGLVTLLEIDHVVMFVRDARKLDASHRDMHQALSFCAAQVHVCESSEHAKRVSPGARQRARDEAWSRWMKGAREVALPLKATPWLRRVKAERQAAPGALLALTDAGGRTCALGVLEGIERGEIRARVVPCGSWPAPARGVVTADAVVSDGHVRTTQAAPASSSRGHHEREVVPGSAFSLPEKPVFRVNLGRGPFVRGASLRTTFVSNLFEDPTVLLRMDHQQRCICVDLGSVKKIPTKVMHQTTDVLLSHAHLDHFGGFAWALRKRIGIEAPLRIWGPRDTVERVWHGVRAYTWDRIGERGPRFDVYEWDGARHMKRARVQAGVDEIQWMEPVEVYDHVLWREPLLTVEARVLDHGGTDVLAFGVQEPVVFAVRGDVIRQRGWKAGHWLGQLKVLAACGDDAATLEVLHIDGGSSVWSVRDLAELLLIAKEGQRIVYATDFAHSPENLDKITALAQGANVLICEAGFVMDDADQAARTGHMTSEACAQVAARAEVDVLVPFHHSMRYDDAPEQLYAEVVAGFERTYVPASIKARMRAAGLLKASE